MRFTEDIQVKQNLFITARERGKIVAKREGHNIFVDIGREWLSQLIAYLTFVPPVYENDSRIRYMGFGIGGTRQLAPAFADAAPLNIYPTVGARLYTDTDPTVTHLERPVRISGAGTPPLATDVWIGQVQAPAVHDTVTSTTFRRLFTATEVSYAPYDSVPISEVGLYTDAAVLNNQWNYLVAYDTFDTISKTDAIDLEVVWVLRIG